MNVELRQNTSKISVIAIIIAIIALASIVGIERMDSQPPAQEQSRKNIIITHYAKKVDMLSPSIKASPAEVFLVITLNIENYGYKEFDANPVFFKLISNNVKYDISEYSNMIDGSGTVNIPDGASASTRLIFEVPQSIENYEIRYQGFEEYEIIYTAPPDFSN